MNKRKKLNKTKTSTSVWVVLVAILVSTILIPVALSKPVVQVDNPPSTVIYTKTGLRKILVTATAKDDIDISSLSITVNDKPVLVIEKKGKSFRIETRHKLSESYKVLTVSVKSGEFYKGLYYKDIKEGNLRKQLDVVKYPIILPPGTYTIKLTVTDSAGQKVEKTVSVTISKDNPPKISISAPSSMRTNTQTANVKVNVKASDDLGLKDIKLFVDNKHIRTIDASNKKSCSGTITLSITGIGKHTIKAVVTDTGNEERSASAQVTLIQNEPPLVSISKIENTVTTSNTAEVRFTVAYSDKTGTVKAVELYVDNKLVGRINPNKASGSWTKTVSLNVGSHNVKAVALDDMGLQRQDVKAFQVRKDNPPSVSITSPKNRQIFWTTGNSVKITIKATAKDDFGIRSIDYYIDNKKIGSGSSVTTTVGIGTHTIKAIATDTRSQTASTTISIIVRKDNPPSVSITSPKNGQVFWTAGSSISIEISAIANDDRKVTKVEFYIDNKLVSTDSSLPYSARGTVTLGTHTITAVAYDSAGQKKSATTSITVRKDNPPSVSFTISDGGDV